GTDGTFSGFSGRNEERDGAATRHVASSAQCRQTEKNWKTFRLSPGFPGFPRLNRVSALAHVGQRHYLAGRWREDGRRDFGLRAVQRRLRARGRKLGTLQDHAHQLLVHPALGADPLHDLLPEIAALVETDVVHLAGLLRQGG